MRNICLILIFIFLPSQLIGQFQIHFAQDSIPKEMNHAEFNPLCFILGTLNDYRGRFTYVDRHDQVDRYYPYEKPAMDFINSLIYKDFNIKVSSNENYETFSNAFAGKLNSYYGKDKHLIAELFRYQDQITSFLTGKYYRYGRQVNDTVCMIQMSNSPDYRICDTLLRMANCTSIYFKYLKNIPAQFIYYFVPSEELRNHFKSIEKQKEILDSSYFETIRKIMNFNNDELNKVKSDIHKKDLIRFIELSTTYER